MLFKVAPYCFLKSGRNANFNLKKYPWTSRKRMKLNLCIEWLSGHQIVLMVKCSSVAMTTVTFQDGLKLTFNHIYFANEFGDLQFVLHLNISFSLSNKNADLKNSKNPIFLKTKNNYLQNFFKICLFIT